MMEVLQFIFASSWHFLGVVVLLTILLDGLKGIVLSLPRRTSAPPVRSIVSAPRSTLTTKEMEN